MRYLIAAAVLGLAGSAMAETWTVDDDGAADFDNIQAAVNAASDGDEIVVEAGTYTGTGDQVVDMLGKAITLRSSQGADVTIIDGEGERRGIACFSGETSKTVIKDLVITGGSGFDGGGIWCINNSPTITNCTISGNTASRNGGGICCFFNSNSSNPTISGCTITGNTADYGGGGISCSNSSNPTISGCTIEGNTASSGGGIYCYNGSSPTISDSQICGNAPNQFWGSYTDAGGNTVANECPEEDCVGDADGSGFVNIEDLLVVLGEYSSCTENCSGDLDDDGDVDIEDMLIVIGAWGPCP